MKLRFFSISILAVLAFASCRNNSTSPPTPAGMGWSMGSFGTSQSIEGVCFPMPAIGYACGTGGTLLMSADSGRTWHALNSSTSEDLYRISFTDVLNGIVGGNNGTLLKTTDGGITWMSINAPFETVNGSLENIRDLKFLDASHVMIVGGAGNTQTGESQGFVMLSSDAGLTWTRVQTTGIGVYSIGSSTPNWQTITVVGSTGEIFRTTDGGATWANESVGDAGDDFLAVDIMGNSGFAITAYGTIYPTSNSGKSWGPFYSSPVTSSLRTVKMLSATEAWQAGDNGVILHTTNDGSNWTRADINGVTVQWNEIVARDPNTLAFVGANGTLYWYAH